jgi:uncharacterized membrane protein
MLDFMWDFVVKYYLTGGYNLVNTLTYGLFLGYVTFKFLIPILKPRLGRIDRSFVLMLLPFILYGSTMREMVDQELGVYAGHTLYPANWFFVSPGIYFSMFAITIFCILLGKILQRLFKVDYRLVVGLLGAALFLYNLALILPNVRHPDTFLRVCFYFILSGALVYAIKVLLKLNFLDFEGNIYIVIVHMFDASTTYVGVDFLGMYEKHVVPTFFINIFHTAAVMYPLKLLVILPALHMIDDEMKDDEFGRRFIKFVILVLGAGPAIRNTILLILG